MAVQLAVAEALKLDSARTARLFSGQRIVMRRDVTPARAKAHIQRFAAMGAQLRLESPSPASAPAPALAATRPADPPRGPAGPGQPEAAAPAPQAVPMAAGVVSAEGSAPTLPPAASAPPLALPSAAPPPGPSASPTTEDGPPSDMGPEARQEHRTRYLAAKQRRAFAISSSGAFGWIGGMPSEAEARERALAQCMSRLPAGDGGCRVVHADAEWLE